MTAADRKNWQPKAGIIKQSEGAFRESEQTALLDGAVMRINRKLQARIRGLVEIKGRISKRCDLSARHARHCRLRDRRSRRSVPTKRLPEVLLVIWWQPGAGPGRGHGQHLAW